MRSQKAKHKMIQLNTKTKLTIVTITLIFLVTIQYYFHQDQQFLNKSSPTFNNNNNNSLLNHTNNFVSSPPPPSPPSTNNFNNFVSSPPPPSPPSTNNFHNDHIDKKSLDPYKFLHIVLNKDGTITRLNEFFPTIPPSNSIDSPSTSLSKDVLLDSEKNTWVRIFLPKEATLKSERSEKLPIVVFVHGGGFILYSAASPIFHFFCDELASRLGTLVVSVEHRLAPENRLPAAYDDVLHALYWVKDGNDEWVNKYGDLSKCVLVGQSAGGNIAYNVMLRASDLVNDLKPLTIMGSILIQPAFGGPNRTGSELRAVNDPVTPLIVGDLMWELALPIGAARSHEFCDPTIGVGLKKLGRVVDLEWRVGVVGCDGDPLIDRQVNVVNVLKSKGVIVKSLFTRGGFHNLFLIDPVAKRGLFEYMKNFFKEL